MRQKRVFPKVIMDHLGCSNRCFLDHFEPGLMGFGPWKIPKCLENGLLWDQKWVKKGSKTRFSKSDRGPFKMLKQVFLTHGWAVSSVWVRDPPPPPPCPPGPLSYQGSIATGHTYGGAKGA